MKAKAGRKGAVGPRLARSAVKEQGTAWDTETSGMVPLAQGEQRVFLG